MRAATTATASSLRRLSSTATSCSGRETSWVAADAALALRPAAAIGTRPLALLACARPAGGWALAAVWPPIKPHVPTLVTTRGFAASALRRAAAEGGPTTAGPAAPLPPRSRDAATRGPAALVRAYKQLSKFRLTCLVVATAAAGYVAGERWNGRDGEREWGVRETLPSPFLITHPSIPSHPIPSFLPFRLPPSLSGSPDTVDTAGLAWTSFGTAACAACANTLNQAYEVASDGRMARTAARPLPSGRLTRAHALWFAAATGAAGLVALTTQVNDLAAWLGAGTIALYAGVYTPLKAVTPAATWVGAVVGAIPPLLGWAGAAGTLQPGAAVLGLGLYFWQLPHFMALARLGRADYARGGLRMLCHADPSGRRVAGCALRNALYLLPLGFAAVAAGAASPPFGAEAAVATGVFAATAAAFYAKPTDANARWVFRASLFHLPAWMGAFLFHRVPNTPAARAAQAPDAVRARAAEFLGRGRGEVGRARGGLLPPHPAWPPAAPVSPRALPFPIGLAPTPPGWMGSGVGRGGGSGGGGGVAGGRG